MGGGESSGGGDSGGSGGGGDHDTGGGMERDVNEHMNNAMGDVRDAGTCYAEGDKIGTAEHIIDGYKEIFAAEDRIIDEVTKNN